MSADPITTEVIRNAFNAIAEDMSAALGRSAFSPVIYECHDYGVALFNEKAETLGQAPGHPFFIGGLDEGVQSVIDKYGADNLRPGDVFVVNDTYITGGHLNDVDILSPIFYRQELVGFASTRAHWFDVGTAEPGFPVNTTEIFQEGIRLGPTRIMDEGEWVRDTIDILCINSRAPKVLMGDLNAQVAACRMGERRYVDLIDRFGLQIVHESIKQIFSTTAAKYRAFIQQIPDGVYESEGWADNDFITDEPVSVKVKVTIVGDRMTIDTTGSSPQRRGNLNCGYANTVSAGRLALVFLYPSPTPEVNHGSFESLDVIAEPGSIFAAREPAACMHPHPGMLMLDLVIKSLAAVIPDCVAAGLPGDSWNVFIMGNRPDTGEFFVSGEAQEGGWGASAHADGESALIHSAAGDFRNIPVETTESRHPILIREVALGIDSGGAGEFRGGLNVVKEYELLTDSKVTLHFDRAVTPQWGLFDGHAGAVPKVTLYPSDSNETIEILKVEQHPLKRGSRLVAETGGGGGYGNPLNRGPERVRLDVRNGYISTVAARSIFGVIFKGKTLSVDVEATKCQRETLRKQQER